MWLVSGLILDTRQCFDRKRPRDPRREVVFRPRSSPSFFFRSGLVATALATAATAMTESYPVDRDTRRTRRSVRGCFAVVGTGLSSSQPTPPHYKGFAGVEDLHETNGSIRSSFVFSSFHSKHISTLSLQVSQFVFGFGRSCLVLFLPAISWFGVAIFVLIPTQFEADVCLCMVVPLSGVKV